MPKFSLDSFVVPTPTSTFSFSRFINFLELVHFQWLFLPALTPLSQGSLQSLCILLHLLPRGQGRFCTWQVFKACLWFCYHQKVSWKIFNTSTLILSNLGDVGEQVVDLESEVLIPDSAATTWLEVKSLSTSELQFLHLKMNNPYPTRLLWRSNETRYVKVF